MTQRYMHLSPAALDAAIVAASDDRYATGVLDLCRERDVRVVVHGSPEYPALLADAKQAAGA